MKMSLFRIGFISVFLVLLGWAGPASVKADHLMGIDISYECLNPCTIRIHWRAYRDCAGIVPISAPNTNPNNPTFFNLLSGGCTPPVSLTNGQWSLQVTTEVTPLCPGQISRCGNNQSPIPGAQEYYRYQDFDICNGSIGCVWRLTWGSSARSSTITSGAANQGMFVNSTTLNTTIVPCNSSPYFTNPPVPFICAGQPNTFNQGAVDPEGDSLSYALGPCSTNVNNQVNYLGGFGFSPQQPLGASWDVNINPVNGDISFTPQPGNIEVAVICVYVTEWRNGVAINTIVRDMQINVLPCPNNQLPTTIGGINVSGANGSGFNFTTCAGTQICFDIDFTDADLGQTVTAFWDENLAPFGATFTDAGNVTLTDTVNGLTPTARFCFIPPAAGTYPFLVTIRDDACPLYGQNQFTFTIQVDSIIVNVVETVNGCGPADLCALPLSGSAPFSFQWSGDGNIALNPNNTDSCFQHLFPGPGDYAYSIVVADSSGLCFGQHDDTITIPELIIDAGSDVTICSGDSAPIGFAPLPNYVYQWSPVTGLADPASSGTNISLLNSTTLPQTFTYVLTATDTVTLCVDEDTVTVTVNPLPDASFSLPNTICADTTSLISYTGWNGAGALFDWNFGSGSIPAVAATQGPHSVHWASAGMQTVTLTVSELGCSTTSSDSVQVWPNPVALIAPVTDQCFINHVFSFVNQGTYGAGATFNWTFSGGATPAMSTAENPAGLTWSFWAPQYAVLQITENGCVSFTDTAFFEIFIEPDASWMVDLTPQCFENNSYDFVTTATNDPAATYAWFFENGSPATSSSQNPANIHFTAGGPQTITLIATQNGCSDTISHTIIVANPLFVDAGPDVSFCEGSGGASLDGTGSGGAPIPPGQGYYWTWWCDSTNTWCGLDSVFDDNPVANPAVSAMYYVQITDFDGCTSQVDSAFVTVLPKPVVDAGPDLYICADSAPCQLLLPSVSNSAGPFDFQWSPSVGLNDPALQSPCARPDTTITYILVVTDANTGCTSLTNTVDTNSSVTVHIQPQPVASAGPDLNVCLGDSVMLLGMGLQAGPQYTYQWSPAAGLSNVNDANPMASPAATVDYVLTVWSNGCPSIGDTTEVWVHTLPTVDAGPDREICPGETALLDAQASGDPFTTSYTYQWTPPVSVLNSVTDEDLMVSPPDVMTYYVTATSDFNCTSAADSVTVWVKTAPIPDAGGPFTICEGDTVAFNASYYYSTVDTVADPTQIIYDWSPAGTLSNAAIQDPLAWPSSTQYYYLSLHYNTCTTTDSVLVNLIPSPHPHIFADTTVACSGDTISLWATGGHGGASFSWTPVAASGPSISVAPEVTTTYVVTVQEGQCSDEAAITISVIPSPEMSFLSSATEGCVPFAVSFLNTSSNSLLSTWEFGDGSISNEDNPIHTYTSPGQFEVTLSGVNTGACADKVTMVTVTVNDTAAAQFSSNPDYPVVLTLPSTWVQFQDESIRAESWNWNFGDGVQATTQNAEHAFEEEGTYYVTLTVANESGCLSRVTHGPYVVMAPDLFIPNVFSPNGDGINDVFLVKYTGTQPFLLQIFDRWGSELFSTRNKNEGWDGVVKGQAAPDGVYYYKVLIGDKDYTSSFTLVK